MTDADDGLLRPVRIIRRLAGRPESPYAGTLAVLPSDESCVLVDAEVIGSEWPGWSARLDDHVLGPLDVLRTQSGHLVALPICRETLDDVIARREASGAALTDGERLTIAVSLLRGCSALPPGVGGEWWMTDDARPVFAAHPHTESVEGAASRILRHLADDSARLAEPLSDAAVLVMQHERLVREAEIIEERLFALVAAEPIALTAFAPRHARTVSALRDADITPMAADRRGLWSDLMRHVDADLADAVSQATTGVWRRFRGGAGRSAGRSGPWIAAGAIAIAIVGGAALVPSAADEPAPVTAPSTEPSTAPSASASADAPAPVDAPAEDGLPGVVSDLLDARRTCAADTTCLADAVTDAATVLPPGPIDLARDERTVTLIDDFGGLAVLRVAATRDEDSAQLVVVVLRDGRWLLRDVHDVAEQP